MLKIENNEERLVSLVCRGDETAKYLVYKENIRYLSAICSRYICNQEDVKDVLQDSFLKIYRSIDSFCYKGEGSLRAWMARIVLNESLKFLKRNCRLEFVELTKDDCRVPVAQPDMEGIPAQTIYHFIQHLPDGYRAVFNLYVVEGKSHREIAEMLGIKESTSASQLHRAKAMLAEMLRKYKLT